MKDTYYADKRDIVKWSGILHLCSETGIKHVFQIAYYRKHKWPPMQFDGKNLHIPEGVLTHFRNIDDIKRLGIMAGVNIEVFKPEFQHSNRDTYHKEICEQISNQTEGKIVFLDPDTGLAPQKPKVEHVRSDEVSMIWQCLKRGDFLVFYQHRFRDTSWIEIRKEQLAEACNAERSTVKQWAAPELASDVVFFFCEK